MVREDGPHPVRPRPFDAGLVAFVGLGLVVLVAVAIAAALLSEVVARRDALADAAGITERFGRLTVGPLLEGALAGDPADLETLDELVAVRLRDGALTSVVVWTRQGTVLYASDPSLVGRRFPLVGGLARAAAGETVAELDEAPETRDPAEGGGALVEVYAPLPMEEEDLVLEAYFSSAGVQQQTDLLRGQILLVAIGGLVVLQLVQLPIAASMARRIRREERAAATLVSRTLLESEAERRAIAADIHDGPVQEVAGVAYALEALELGSKDPDGTHLAHLGGALQAALSSLRRVMVEVYPPDVGGPGLSTAVSELARSLEDDGLTVVVDVADVPAVTPEVAAVVYRTARELVSNVRRHSGARRAWVTLARAPADGATGIVLTVADDGVGLPPDAADRRGAGHLGLRLVLDRVSATGGRADLGVREGGGAEVVIVLPVRDGAPLTA